MSRTDTPNTTDEGFEDGHRLMGLVETNGAVAWVTSCGCEKLLYLSPGANEMFCRPTDELVADPNWRIDVIHPDDLPGFKDSMSRLGDRDAGDEKDPKANQPPHVELYRIVRPDGQTRWIEDRISLLPPPKNGSPSNEDRLIGGIMSDVTDRIDEETRMRESDSAWHSLAETIPMSMIRKDMLGRIVFANQRYCEQSKQTFDQLIGKTNFDLFPAELARKYTEDDGRMIADGQPIRMIEDHLQRDGTTANIEVFKAPIRNKDGLMIGFLVLFRDITEHKQTEHAFNQERYLLDTLLENIPDNIYFKDRESRFIRVSNSLARKFGLDSAEDSVGLSDADFFKGESATGRLDDEQHLINGEADVVEKLETEFWPDRGDIWVHTTKLPLRDADGQVIGTFGISRDITANKRAEGDLERERDRLKTIIDNVPDIIFVKDRYGRFVNGNKAFRESLSIDSLDDLIGKTDYDIWPAELACHFVADDQIVMRSGKPLVNHEESTKDTEGNEAWLLTSKVPLYDPNGKVTGLVGIGRDITKSRQVKEQLSAAKDAADAANRAKSDFLANMSHEIRTPMNAIIGMTELLMDMELKQGQLDYLKMIQDSGDSLLTVINDILDFSKIEAGKLELDPVTFDLRESLGDAIKSLATRAHAKRLELAFRVQKDVPEVLHGDVGRFRQVIVNLVGNAIKFTEKGEVVVDVGVSRSTKDDSTLVVKVRDTGIGIPSNVCERIFDEFQQADSSTTRRYGGTGLGLAISSRLIELMGGHIGVTSREGIGSEFSFTVRFDVREAGELPGVPVIVGGTRVLIVDDNETNRLILDEMLSNWGMQPNQVAAGDQALKELRRAELQNLPYQIVISDGNMPGMDGFRLAEHIRNDETLKDSPIIMLTSGTHLGDVAARERLGIDVCLMKPAKQSEVFDAIVRVLGVNMAEDSGSAPTEDELDCRSLDVLLAEDNVVNQKLAISVLENQGHRVDLATNGLEAVEMSAGKEYDLILMDVQMPIMDGLDATRAIRQRDSNSDRHQLIVAMTAHAMKGDRDTCIDAGMDDYLSKPIRIKDLADKIFSLFGANEGSDDFAGEINPAENTATLDPVAPEPDLISEITAMELESHASPKPVALFNHQVDWKSANANVGHNPKLLRELIAVFLEDLPRLMGSVSEAIKNRDAKQLKSVSHMLKGSLLFLNAKAPFQNAVKLEQMGSTDELEESEVILGILRRNLTDLELELNQFLEDEA